MPSTYHILHRPYPPWRYLGWGPTEPIIALILFWGMVINRVFPSTLILNVITKASKHIRVPVKVREFVTIWIFSFLSNSFRNKLWLNLNFLLLDATTCSSSLSRSITRYAKIGQSVWADSHIFSTKFHQQLCHTTCLLPSFFLILAFVTGQTFPME